MSAAGRSLTGCQGMLCSAEQSRDSGSACAMHSVSGYQIVFKDPVLDIRAPVAPCGMLMAWLSLFSGHLLSCTLLELSGRVKVHTITE